MVRYTLDLDGVDCRAAGVETIGRDRFLVTLGTQTANVIVSRTGGSDAETPVPPPCGPAAGDPGEIMIRREDS